MTGAARSPLLEVDGLTVDYWGEDGWVNVVDAASFAIRPAEALGLAGESGCGKSTVAAAILGERRPGSRVRAGRTVLEGTDLLRLDEAALQPIRGRRVSFVPQNPGSSLTPSMVVGRQIVEVLEAHDMAHGRAAERRAVALLGEVGLPDPADSMVKLPHQLSGGQQQRVVLALALACRPSLVVLDEPTTGLDVTTQQRILELLADLRQRFGLAMLYISHDLAALSQICTRIAVMYAGHIVETGGIEDLFAAPRHPYTRGLIASVPRIDRPPDEQATLSGVLRRETLPPGCRFAPRCPHAVAPRCFEERQGLEPLGHQGSVACWRWRELASPELAQ